MNLRLVTAADEEPLIPAAHTHDGFFKAVFSQPEHATALFKSYLQIYHTLSTNPELEKSTMSVAEILKAEGRLEGISKALWVGRIQTMQEFLGLPVSSCENLETLALDELEVRHAGLHREYEARFKSQ